MPIDKIHAELSDNPILFQGEVSLSDELLTDAIKFSKDALANGKTKNEIVSVLKIMEPFSYFSEDIIAHLEANRSLER